MKRQITYLLAVCMLSALLCGCGRSEKQTAGTKPTAPVQTAAATEAPEPQTLGDIPDVDDIVRCYKELVNGNYGVEYDSSAPLPGGFDGVGEWYPVTNYGSLSELRRHVQQYLSDALMEQRHFGDSLQEVDGKLYWQQSSKGYVRYRVDRQKTLTRDETLDAQYGASAIRHLWSFTAARTITAETRRWFSRCAPTGTGASWRPSPERRHSFSALRQKGCKSAAGLL